jgi:hypothetical protein
VQWRPHQLGLDVATLEQVLVGLHAFVREAQLPYSIIDEAVLDAAAAARLVASIPPPTEGERH